MLPEKIGHYTIVSELGRGGMGVVYKAREEALNRFVAIKVLTEQLTEDATFLQRFVREAQAAAALSHPNIVQIFFIGEDQGHPYFVMEYVTGRSLNHLLREEGRIDNPRASQMMLQAAHGLAAAHDQGIIHRDIKPANLILDERGIVKIADFGLALPVDAETRLTASGMLVGTPGYLAPEQCRGEKVDNRTDIYALGITFYLLLSGQAPFRGESPLALLRQILDEQPPDISTLNPNVDTETRRILQKMIAKDREQRYQNCHDLVSDFEDYLAKAGVRSMTAGLASRKTAASDAAVAAAAMVAPTSTSNATASAAQQSVVTQRTLEPIAAAPIASVHDTPTVHVSASNIEPPTQPPAPYQEPKTQPPAPMPVAAASYAPPLTSTSSSSNARTLIILAAIIVALVAAALLVAKNFFPGKPDAPAVASAATTQTTASTTSSAPATATSALLAANTVTTTIGDGPTSVPPATTTTPATTTAAPAPQSQQQQQQVPVQRASAITPVTAAPARTNTPPVAQSKPARGLSGVVFAVTGDQQLVGSVSTVVSSELSAASLDAVDAETLASMEEMVRRGDVSVSRLLDRVRAEGRAVLLLVRVDPAGQRELSYMGRHDTAYSSRVTLTAYDVASGRAIGVPNKGTIEYTSATADRESEKVVGRLARASVEAIQNR